MRELNFSISDDFISLNYNGENIDLHNNYDFTDFSHEIESNKAECIFNKRDDEWVPKTSINNLTLRFENVSSVFHKSHDDDYPVDYLEKDQGSVDMIGYSYDTDEIMAGVTDNVSSNELPSMLIVFVTGKAIKIVANSVEIIVNKNYS